MSEKTCASCRFMAAERAESMWSYIEDDEDVYSHHHSCVRIVHGNDNHNAQHFNELACVVDGSGYSARLIVLPTFGCVLHEAKS